MPKINFIIALLCLLGSSTQAQGINEELEFQTFTRRFMTAYNAQDHAAIGKMYTDDAVRIELVGADNRR